MSPERPPTDSGMFPDKLFPFSRLQFLTGSERGRERGREIEREKVQIIEINEGPE